MEEPKAAVSELDEAISCWLSCLADAERVGPSRASPGGRRYAVDG